MQKFLKSPTKTKEEGCGISISIIHLVPDTGKPPAFNIACHQRCFPRTRRSTDPCDFRFATCVQLRKDTGPNYNPGELRRFYLADAVAVIIHATLRKPFHENIAGNYNN